MTTIRAVITVKDQGLRRFRSLVSAGLGGGSGGGKATSAPAPGGSSNPFERWRTQAATRYSAFAQTRFSTFSRGGGDWPALQLSTIRARAAAARGREGKGGGSGDGEGARESFGRSTPRKAKGRATARALFVASGRTVSILSNKGILKLALKMGGPGNRVTRLPNGVQYGFDDTPHPGGVTMGQLTVFHHFGKGHNPVRRILVDPDAATKAGITLDLNDAVKRSIALSKAGGP